MFSIWKSINDANRSIFFFCVSPFITAAVRVFGAGAGLVAIWFLIQAAYGPSIAAFASKFEMGLKAFETTGVLATTPQVAMPVELLNYVTAKLAANNEPPTEKNVEKHVDGFFKSEATAAWKIFRDEAVKRLTCKISYLECKDPKPEGGKPIDATPVGIGIAVPKIEIGEIKVSPIKVEMPETKLPPIKIEMPEIKVPSSPVLIQLNGLPSTSGPTNNSSNLLHSYMSVWFPKVGSADDEGVVSSTLVPRIAEQIGGRKDCMIFVSGNTDTLGTDDSNKRLAERRAEVVLGVLKAKLGNLIEVKGGGNGERNRYRFTVDDRNEIYNRRTDIHLSCG